MKSSILVKSFLPVFAAVILVAGIAYAMWHEPTASPPGENVAAPINVGATDQYKSGALGVGGLLRGYGNAIFDGNVGIGMANPSQKLDVAGGVKVDGGMLIGASTAGGNKGTGTINADQVCIRGVCQTTWPSGGTTTQPPAKPCQCVGTPAGPGPVYACGTIIEICWGTVTIFFQCTSSGWEQYGNGSACGYSYY